MKKIHLVTAIGGGVAAVAILAMVGLLVAEVFAVSESREKADATFKAIERFYKTSDPFPSRENIEAASKRQALLEERIVALRTLLSDGAVDGREMSPQMFGRLRENTVSELIAAAPRHDDGTAVVPEGSAFGFGRYDSGIPAAKADVPRLVRQLAIVEKLVRILYAADVRQVVAVGREEFEAAGEKGAVASSDEGAARPSFRRVGLRRGAKAASAQTGSSIAVPSTASIKGEAGVPVRLERFGLVFDAREKSLLSVLRALDAMKPFAMISSFSMEKQADDVVYPAEKAEDEAKGRRAAATPAPAAPTGIREKPAPRTARLVSGPLREADVRVTLFVDVWAFPETDEPEGEGEEPSAEEGEEEV